MSDDALFERKLKMLPMFRTDTLFTDWERLDGDLTRVENERALQEQAVSSAKAEVEYAEIVATDAIEGRNAEERKALRARALHRDPVYINAVMVQKQATLALSVQDATIDQIKRQIRRIESRIRVYTEAMHFLG